MEINDFIKQYNEIMFTEKTEPTWLQTYYKFIKEGKIIVGNELMLQLEKLIADLDNPRYVYDTRESDARILFMETCCLQSKAPFYNKPIKLLLWQKCFFECIYSFKMAETGLDRFKNIILIVARKAGKLLAENTKIPTPIGFKEIKDIHIGDYVFDVDGKKTLVVNESEIVDDHKCYEITFEDGEKIVAADTHLWAVQTKYSRRTQKYIPKTNRKTPAKDGIDKYGYYILETQDMINDFVRVRPDGKGKEYKYRVPMNKAVQYEKQELPIDPYMFGYWLGNGNSSSPRLTVTDEDVEIIASEAKKSTGLVSICKNGNKKCKTLGLGSYLGNKNTFMQALKDLGVYKNKYIPDIYLYSSVEQRMELLRGLLDSDGNCKKSGEVEFSQKREHLAKQVRSLLSGLGIKNKIVKRITKCEGKEFESYRITFYTDKENSCFKLPRKHNRLKDKLASRMDNKSIIDIKEVPSVRCKCITVANERGLFLCGDNYTTTHNSSMFAADAMYDLFVGEGGSDIVTCSIDDKTAKLIFEEIKKMASKLDRKEKIVHKTIVNIENVTNNTYVFKLSAKSKNLDGFNCSKAIQDELHQDDTDAMAMAVIQSMSVRDNPKYIGVSTNGFLEDGYLERKLKYCRAVLNDEYEDETQLSFLYTQDSENEIWQNPLSWYKSNPSLGIVKKWDALKEKLNSAKFEKATKIHVLCKDFNIKQNSAEAFLMESDYSYEQVVTNLEDFRDCYCFGAVDLAATTDLSCAKVLFMKPNDNRKYIFTKYFIPSSKLTDTDDKTAGAKYDEWARNGLLDIHEGNEIDLSKIAEWFKNLYMDYGIRLFKLGYDQRFAKDFLTTMDSYGYGSKKGEVCEMINQSKWVMSNPIKLLEADLKSQIVHGINDMDKWCFSNAAIEVDDNQLVMLIKTNQHKRIDGIVTAAILYGIFSRYRSDYMKYIRGEA